MTSVDRIQGLSGSLAVKAPCRVATTANITLSGEQTIDGVAVVEDDRVLVKAQTDGTENGIYDVSTGAWTRSLDFDGANDAKNGTLVLVTAGTVGANLVYRTSGVDPIVPGTTAVTFPVSLAGTTVSPFAATLLDDADAVAARTTLGAAASGANSDITRLTALGAGAVGTPTLAPSGDPNTGVFFPAADTVAVSTGGAERMRIDTRGNVGIGVTPDAWASNSIGMDFATDCHIGPLAANSLCLSHNSYYDGAYKAKSTGEGAQLLISGNNGFRFYSFASVAADATQTATLLAQMGVDGTFTLNRPAGLGYGTGAGGTVTQATSKSTAVTLNKPTGQITMNNAALAAGATVIFALNNSLITAVDCLVVNPTSYGNYIAQVVNTATGAASIRVTNITGGSLSEALTIQFAIIKGAAS